MAAASAIMSAAKQVGNPSASGYMVAFPGEEGSLAHLASTRFFSSAPDAKLQGVSSLAETFKAVEEGKVLYGIVPIENSASGSIPLVYDLLIEHNLIIGGELAVRENYCLCAKEGTEIAKIKSVHSHPNILEACSTYLEEKVPATAEKVSVSDTAKAARHIATEGASGDAAIATRDAARLHNLSILASNIGNYTQLETRYVVLHTPTGPASAAPAPFPKDAISPMRKKSAVFALNDEPAAIFKLLSCWALRNINVLKVETRPLKAHKAPKDLPVGNLWDFLIFVDYEVKAGQTPEDLGSLWENLVAFTQWQRDLGTYPSQVSRKVKQETQEWDHMIDMMTKG